jgi:hypothetical protein
MNTEPSEAERPEEEFEIVEIDVTPFLTDEQRSWPVVRCERPEEEFAIEEPLPALNVRVHGGATPAEGRLPVVVGVLSEQEVLLGGSGLEMSLRSAQNGTVMATLVPRTLEGARGRFERLARWWAAASGSEAAVTVV